VTSQQNDWVLVTTRLASDHHWLKNTSPHTLRVIYGVNRIFVAMRRSNNKQPRKLTATGRFFSVGKSKIILQGRFSLGLESIEQGKLERPKYKT